jgi:hypothetical protein
MMDRLLGFVFQMVETVLVILALMLVDGFVVWMLWGWFITPAFPAVPDIGIWEAAGISLLVGFLTIQHNPSLDKPKEETREAAFERAWPHVKWQVEVIMITLIAGYLVHWMVPLAR